MICDSLLIIFVQAKLDTHFWPLLSLNGPGELTLPFTSAYNYKKSSKYKNKTCGQSATR